MAFCKNCGTQLKDGDLFCQTCGQKNEVSSTPNLNVNQQEPKSDDLLEKGMKPDSGEAFATNEMQQPKMNGDFAANEMQQPKMNGDFAANEMQQPKMNGDFVTNEMQPKTNGDFGANQMKPDSDEVFVIDKKENSGKKSKGKKNSGKKIVVGLVSLAVVAVALLAGFLILKNMSKKVPLDECIKVEVYGYDTLGYAEISLDEEALLECIADAKGEELKKEGSKSRERQMEDWDFDEIIELIEVTAEKETGLSNGDEILIEISFDNEEAKEYGIKFVGDTYKYKVKGLEELEEVDLFEDLEVNFKGTAPFVYLEYYYDGDLTYTGKFSADKSNDLNVGDVVTITFEGEEDLLESGYKVATTSKEYTCEDVDKYLEKTAELDEEALDNMKKDAQDCIEAYFAKNTDYIGYTNLSYAGNYVLVRKDNVSYEVNKVYLIYSAEVSSKETHKYSRESEGIAAGDPVFKPQTVYMPISFKNIIMKADGTIEYTMNGTNILGYTDLTYNGWYTLNGYTDGSKMYNDLVVTAKTEYTCDASEDLTQFGEAGTDTKEEKGTAATENTGDYILPNSNSAYLKESDLEGLTKEEIRLATNEIYARHGYIFEDQELQAYFEGKDWYQGTVKGAEFNASVFNEYELANKDLIVTYAEKKGYR